jgi:hypothetical protein
VTWSDTTRREPGIGMPSGVEVDDLLEPVWSWPEPTTLPPLGAGMPGSRTAAPPLRS